MRPAADGAAPRPKDLDELSPAVWQSLVERLRASAESSPPITAAACQVALAMSVNADFHTGEVWTSVRRLERVTGRGRTAIRGAFEELKAVGLIEPWNLADETADGKGLHWRLVAADHHFAMVEAQTADRRSRWSAERSRYPRQPASEGPEHADNADASDGSGHAENGARPREEMPGPRDEAAGPREHHPSSAGTDPLTKEPNNQITNAANPISEARARAKKAAA